MSDITFNEMEALAIYHQHRADWHKSCRDTKERIANTKPLYRFGDMQTRQDWLIASEKQNDLCKQHRNRARFWKNKIRSLRKITNDRNTNNQNPNKLDSKTRNLINKH